MLPVNVEQQIVNSDFYGYYINVSKGTAKYYKDFLYQIMITHIKVKSGSAVYLRKRS